MSTPRAKRDWQVAGPDRASAAAIAKALAVPHIVAHLLTLRGVGTPDEARRFLDPSRETLSDPFLLTDMRAAVDRIHRARTTGEHVRVFGDYDVDGISGTALLVLALRRFGIEHLSHAIPSRHTDGYGLGVPGVDEAHADGVGLLITVDNGTTAHDAARRARQLGVDLIVTDHHTFNGDLPVACAVINPLREDPSYPGRAASGAAVAFRLAQALTGEKADLDLVALGTVADMVPLLGENRALVHLGLRDAAERRRPGLDQLAAVSGKRLATLTSEDIAFQLAPRINAAGRVADQRIGLDLLLAETQSEARALAKQLDDVNEQRRQIEAQVTAEAYDELERSFRPEQRSIVLASRAWRPGVVGIVATRIQSRYYRPVVLIAFDENGLGRGSARGIADFDVAQALAACESHLVRHGGHLSAGGITLHEADLEAFRDSFEEQAAAALPEGELVQPLPIDAVVSFSEVDPRLVQLLERLQPFGQGNPTPVFCTYGVRPIARSCRRLRGGHLRFSAGEGPRNLTCIGFRMAEYAELVESGAPLDIAYSPRFNTWNGETTIQLVLKDIRPSPQ